LNVCTVLIFFIAGLLFLCLEHVIHRERIASRRRPAFSSHLVNAITSEVDLDEGNFAGLATYRPLGASSRTLSAVQSCKRPPNTRAGAAVRSCL